MKILITGPSLSGKGGVAGYYKSILPFLYNLTGIKYFELGSEAGRILFHPISDQLSFYKHISNRKYDLIHVNPSLNFKSFIRDGLLIWQAKRKNIPVIIFFRGWDTKFEPFVKKIFFFFKLTYGKADAFIVLANEFKRKLRQWGVSKPIHVETTTVDDVLIKKFSISSKLKQLNESNKIKILFLSRLERGKGIFETIDAVCELLKKEISISLSIAGDGNIIQELKKYVKKQKAPEGSICFLGYVKNSDKIDAFTSHHIYCLPSYSEGMPNSVLEAMAFGMPVITTSVGGLKDFFEDEKMGCLIKSINPKTIAKCLNKIIPDKNKLIEISYYNHTYAKKHFLASTCAQKIMQIYNKTLDLN